MGGALGAVYVIVVIIFVQSLGAATLTAIFVTAQLITSIVLDLLGAVGFAKRTVSWPRFLGAGFMIVGVILITQFPGQVVADGRVQQRMKALQSPVHEPQGVDVELPANGNATALHQQ